MSEIEIISLRTPHDLMVDCAKRARALRIKMRIPQTELAERVGVAVGTIKRFENEGEIQFRTLLEIALVLNRMDDFAEIFKQSSVPQSLYAKKTATATKRARKK